jgi:hypothetical protein
MLSDSAGDGRLRRVARRTVVQRPAFNHPRSDIMGQSQDRNQQNQGSSGSGSSQQPDRSSQQEKNRGQANQGQQDQSSPQERQRGQNSAGDENLSDMDEDEPGASSQQSQGGSKGQKR